MIMSLKSCGIKRQDLQSIYGNSTRQSARLGWMGVCGPDLRPAGVVAGDSGEDEDGGQRNMAVNISLSTAVVR